jgi:Meiotically up-regulated gene 113
VSVYDESLRQTSYSWWCRRTPRSSFVYFIQALPETPVKIGVAENVRCRLASLQTGNPELLRALAVLPGTHELEWQLHNKFKADRRSGEWFEAEAIDFEWVQRLNDAMAAVYAGDGIVPSYRQPGFEWVRFRGAPSRPQTRFIEPTPVAADVARERLRKAWMGPDRAWR